MAKQERVKLIEKVKVTNKAELESALKPFLPGSKSLIRESLLEGFNIVKNRKEYNEKAGRNFDPDTMLCWVDKLIDQRLAGKRRGLSIAWELSDGKFKFDPWTGELLSSGG